MTSPAIGSTFTVLNERFPLHDIASDVIFVAGWKQMQHPFYHKSVSHPVVQIIYKAPRNLMPDSQVDI